MKRLLIAGVIVITALTLSSCDNQDKLLFADAAANRTSASTSGGGGEIDDDADVGGSLFFDTTLSGGVSAAHAGISAQVATAGAMCCAECHRPINGFADLEFQNPTSNGVNPGTFGFRNAQTVAYASYSPSLHQEFDPVRLQNVYVGGLYWDGRDNGLAAQALGPLMNPLEMANHSFSEIIASVAAAPYARKFERVFGPLNGNSTQVVGWIGDAIAAYESSIRVNRFSSRYDYYLAGFTNLTAEEERGMGLFSANCSDCHPVTIDANGQAPLFTNFTFYNIGVPRNPDNPYYLLPPEQNPDGWAFTDRGLGGQLGVAAEEGKFKVPTLRNVALTQPYTHNGSFATLNEMIGFLNTRDVPGSAWASPEINANLETLDTGNMGLDEAEVSDLAAFLRTLTDGFGPPLGERLDRLNKK